MAFTIGLTGGIGSGKTTVARLFVSLGAGLVDTDEISHRLTAAGQPAVIEIARKFGQEFVAPDGSLDRESMRKLVFDDPSKRKDLEAFLHPLIHQESLRQIREVTAPYIVVVVPLLLESAGYKGIIDRVVVVDCDPETQVRRVMQRSGLARNEVLSIIASQVPRERRLRAADDIIGNDGDIARLREQVDALHTKYLRLAADR
jgi:dephospho-CoA kinase